MFDSHQADSSGEHLADLDIVLESDGELSERRARQLRHHLASCWSCRARKSELDRSVSGFVQLYREQFDGPLPPAELPKKLLQAHLDEAGRTVQPSPWWATVLAKRTAFAWAAVVSLLVLAIASVHRSPRDQDMQRSVLSAGAVLPNPELSPGSALPISREQVCQMKDNGDDRLNDTLARTVFERYGVAQPAAGKFEIDYVVPPALGGQQSAKNLWPQPYEQGAWNSHTKDALEKRLEWLVCSKQIDLRQAQDALSSDWVDAYKNYFHSSQPLVNHAAFTKDRAWPFSTQGLSH